MTRLGDFRKFLAKKYLTKVAQTFFECLGYFQTNIFYCKNLLWQLFCQLLETIWLFFVNCWKQFGYFSFQHLVSLVVIGIMVEHLLNWTQSFFIPLVSIDHFYPEASNVFREHRSGVQLDLRNSFFAHLKK